MTDCSSSPEYPIPENIFVFKETTQSKLYRKKFDHDEDELLKSLVLQLGENWSLIAKNIPGRTTRQCRERYKNYLAPNIRNSPWTPEEDALLISKFNEIGPKWAYMSKFFTGRSDNCIKNRWYTYLRPSKQEQKICIPAPFMQDTTQTDISFDNFFEADQAFSDFAFSF